MAQLSFFLGPGEKLFQLIRWPSQVYEKGDQNLFECSMALQRVLYRPGWQQ